MQEPHHKTSRVSLEQLSSLVFFLGVFFIPFSSFEGPSFMGEFKKEASIYFFLIAFLLVVVTALFSRKLYIPYNNLMFQVLVLLLAWFVIATLLNAGNIKDYYFKYTHGFSRFIRQYAVLFASAFVLLIGYYNITRRYSTAQLFYKIRTVFLFSLLIVSAFGFVEIAIVKFGMGQLKPLFELLNYFPFTEMRIDDYKNRVSSVTFEPPALATYLLTVSGWMFSYLITSSGIKRYIPAVLVIVLSLFSGSRAGLVIIVIQALVFGVLLIKKRKHHAVFIKILAVGAFLVMVVGVVKGKVIANYIQEKITSFGVQDEEHKISNKSRFGTQTALFEVFLDHPISGVGFGQQAYEARWKYPAWATSNNWEFKIKYFNPDHPSFPPGYNIFARILAESGIIGLLLFLSFLFLIFYSCFSLSRKDGLVSIFAIVLLVSMLGFVMNWMKMDTFRVFGFWVSFALLLSLTQKTRFVLNPKPETPNSATTTPQE